MPRYISAPDPTAFLSDAALDFLRRRAFETGGFILFAIAALLTALLVSYTPGDPSLNAVTDMQPGNILGLPGAYIADFLLQTFGLAGVLPVVALIAWGTKLCRKSGIHRPSIRLVKLFAGMIIMSFGLSALPQFQEWPLAVKLGGIIGTMGLSQVIAWTQSLGPFINEGSVGFIFGCAGLALLAGASGLNSSECQSGLSTLKFFTVGAAIRTWRAFRFVSQLGTSRKGLPPLPKTPKDPTISRPLKNQRSTPEPKIEAKAPRAKTGKKATALKQQNLNLGQEDEYQIPALEILEAAPAVTGVSIAKDALQQNAHYLSTVLEDFGVHGEIVKVRPGPVVTLYELEPAPGTKTSRVVGLSDDIARSMSAISVRVAVVPGRNVIGIELPNADREMVYLRELLESDTLERASGSLNIALGKDIGGNPVAVDLARMPHLLIAGTTGSGKSVAVNTMILSLLYQYTPDQCKFIMIDPKMLELSVYEGIPHLLAPVVTDPPKAVMALKWTVREMEDRYRTMSNLGVRNIAGYNKRVAEATKKGEVLTRQVQTGFDEQGKPIIEDQPLSMEPLPLIVVVVDEMADLMLVAGKDIEGAVQRLAQMARAAGIHLIMATQRPSVDVITGTIKANFPTRISFQVTSKIDSRTILGEQGAEQLLGQGDMLYMAGGGRISRVHGPFVSDKEVENVVAHLKSVGTPDYIESVTEEADDPGTALVGGNTSEGDALYDEAVALIAREGKASTSFIQRHLQIGYNRAARIIERMEGEGVVSKANRVGRREVLIGNVGENVL
ncbi:MAG: cell division protein FtsK [Rhodospirillales bacterium]|nr:cell division protein FtsK [Rhodospirillales bacterium]